MKKAVVALFVLMILATASLAQAYVFNLYTDPHLAPTSSVAGPTFSTGLSGMDSKTIYFSIASDFASDPAHQAVSLAQSFAYSGSGYPWGGVYTMTEWNKAPILGGGGGTGYGAGTGTGTASTNLFTGAIYSLAMQTFGQSELTLVLKTPTQSASTPIPAALWLLGSGLAGLVGLRKKFLA